MCEIAIFIGKISWNTWSTIICLGVSHDFKTNQSDPKKIKELGKSKNSQTHSRKRISSLWIREGLGYSSALFGESLRKEWMARMARSGCACQLSEMVTCQCAIVDSIETLRPLQRWDHQSPQFLLLMFWCVAFWGSRSRPTLDSDSFEETTRYRWISLVLLEICPLFGTLA